MSALSVILPVRGTGSVYFMCPGCNEPHRVQVGAGPGPRWTYNGNPEKPTFSPSILLKSGHYCEGQEGKDCWCTYEARLGRKPPFVCKICHSFVTDGRIQFLSDCTHGLAGQTVDLPLWDASWNVS